MADTVPVTEAGSRLAALVQRAVAGREHITLTDGDRPPAVLISAQELADLEDRAAFADFQARRASGRATVTPHAAARALLLDE